MNRRNIRDALVLVIVAAVATGVLSAVDGGVLAAPRSWGLDGWTELIAERGAAAAAMTLLRYAALALSAYLVLLGLLTLTVRLVRMRWLDAVLWFATPRILRPLLGIVSVATFAAPHAAGAAEPAGGAANASKTPVMVLVGSSAERSATATTVTASTPPPTMRRVEPATTQATIPTTTIISTTTVPATAPTTTVSVAITMPPRPSAPATSSPATSASAGSATLTEATPPPPGRSWSIKRGEHLWFVAETVLTEQLGRVPSTKETTGYWQRLIKANRDRLVDQANPDLVFTGQELVLPAH